MKNNFFLIALVIAVSFASCKNKKEEVKQTEKETKGIQVLADRIEYDVLIDNEGSMDAWMNHIEQAPRLEFISGLFNGLKAGQAVNDDGKPVTEEEVMKVIQEKYPSANAKSNIADLIAQKKITIRKLRFREKWTYDYATFKLTKEVAAVGPVLEYQDGDLFRPVMLFWINCDTTAEIKDATMMTDNMISDAIVNNEIDQIRGYDSIPADYFSNLAEMPKITFFDGLIEAVMDTKIPTYDYFFHPMTEKPGGGFSAALLGKIKFAESWNYQTLDNGKIVFEKAVFALNPCIMVMDEEFGGIKGFKPLFWIVTEDGYQKKMEGKGEMVM